MSDKGAKGERQDLSGPKIQELLPKDKYEVISYTMLPDDREKIRRELIRLSDEVKCDLILTTGGTRIFTARYYAGSYDGCGRA